MASWAAENELKAVRNPWDIPPFAKRGNRSRAVLFEAKGRALDAWEQVESELAHLFSAFTKEDRFDLAANLAYGEPNTVPQRLTKLRQSAEAYFVAHPSQNVEAEFDRLTAVVQNYSLRRNDIAHGIVRPFHWIVTPANCRGMREESQAEWCLIPPHYRPKVTPNIPAPAFLLTSKEINAFGDVFQQICHALSNLSIWAIQHAPPSPRFVRPRPSALPYAISVPHVLRG
jgi:hypothetical protein